MRARPYLWSMPSAFLTKLNLRVTVTVTMMTKLEILQVNEVIHVLSELVSAQMRFR